MIYLSPPNMGDRERALLSEAIDSGWAAPVGPQLDLFEKKLETLVENRRALALNSGTSSLHLALVLSGIQMGDDVIVGTFTFAACGNAVLYLGATPVFMDSEKETWNLDPDILLDYLNTCDKKPRAVIVTHLYGVPAKIDRIKTICEENEVTLIEDAAEAIGSRFEDRQVGAFGDYGIFSFNGNKLVTTSGGGAIICANEDYERGLHLATQANSDEIGYDHSEIGYNYRLSNLLAGVGLAQFEKLDVFVRRKREIFQYYQTNLHSSLHLASEPQGTFCNRWLTTPLLEETTCSPLELVRFLKDKKIHARPLWKPLHLHKVYSNFSFVGDRIAEGIYERGLCLPSGTGLSDDDLAYIVSQINSYLSSSRS